MTERRISVDGKKDFIDKIINIRREILPSQEISSNRKESDDNAEGSENAEGSSTKSESLSDDKVVSPSQKGVNHQENAEESENAEGSSTKSESLSDDKVVSPSQKGVNHQENAEGSENAENPVMASSNKEVSNKDFALSDSDSVFGSDSSTDEEDGDDTRQEMKFLKSQMNSKEDSDIDDNSKNLSKEATDEHRYYSI